MRRLALSLCMWTATALTLSGTGSVAYAQNQPPASPPAGGAAAAEPPAAEPPAEPPAALPGETASAEVSGARTPTDDVKLQQGRRWDDIAVLPRRYSLKARRVELVPHYHFTLNNPLIRHHAVGGQVNFFLSEALWLGLEGQYYFPQQTNDATGNYFLTGVQTKSLPAVNKLIFSALLDFGYVPAYGKFALFNRAIVHWEGYVTLGVGAYMSEVIPVKRSDPSFRNINVMVAPGLGSRLFLTKWLALNAFLKMYMYPDKFEPVANASFSREPGGGCSTYLTGKQSGSTEFEDGYRQCRSDNANSSFVLDVVFGLGLSVFLPPKFEYKLQR